MTFLFLLIAANLRIYNIQIDPATNRRDSSSKKKNTERYCKNIFKFIQTPSRKSMIEYNSTTKKCANDF